MSTIVACAKSDSAVQFLLNWLDVWHIEHEIELFRIGLEIGCRFTFPEGDPRIKRVLSCFIEHPIEWTILEEP